MFKRSSKKKTVGRAFFFAALVALPAGFAGATDLSIEAQCDAAAGSRYDATRNAAFAPVEADDIKLGVALSACREAYNSGGGARMAFQLGRGLQKAGQDLEALKLYGEAAKLGHTTAMANYGGMLGARGDQVSEFGLYRKAAEAGDLLGAYNLGVAYRDGIGTAVDGAEAMKWFEKASAAGDETAAFNIGVLLDDGSLVEEDNAKAAAYYRIAAERGNVDAMINLGLMLEAGEGIGKDLGSAAGLFRMAAERGDSYGTFKLGLMQQNGAGIVKNIEEAVSRLVAAFELKDVDLEILLRDRPAELSAEARLAIKQVLAERKLIAVADNAEIDPITLGAIEKHYQTSSRQ
ncbi:sel1 repeat family protein [Rhizobium sp. TRM95111]|uniref:tetratricopeptide repeat protein n=1 Tax=Rhizobium alarense TaxID=2846851 RepID=UPI001F27109C|nr:tetratricopeptide repeat protein [Rhizobium alarense]MCF3639141.1 sel1 repeat family protein [Rhizobium alarense]